MPKPTILRPGIGPSASEWGKLRSYLARAGVSQAMITEAVGSSINGRTRGQICEQLRGWLRERPAAALAAPVEAIEGP